MEYFVNFIKENYTYLVYILQALIAFIGATVAVIKSRRSASLKKENDSLFKVNLDSVIKNHFLSMLPHWISQANILYPCHGDGLRRFDFVYQKALVLFDEEPSVENRSFVSESIDAVLNADKLEKLPYPVDTQGFEPKKELYEKKKDVEVERPESLCQDGEENKSVECGARYVSWRN